MLVDLLNLLKREGVETIVVDNLSTRSSAVHYVDPGSARYLWRPGWSIYKTWNFGMRYGALRNENVLVLNDDIALAPGGPTALDKEITEGGWAVLGFDYKTPVWNGLQNRGTREAKGTLRNNGVGCFAFGVNPRKSGRCHTGYIWWGGDDDLIYHTLSVGGRVGVMMGNPVDHETSTSATKHGDLLPKHWFEHDRQLLKSRWGESW